MLRGLLVLAVVGAASGSLMPNRASAPTTARPPQTIIVRAVDRSATLHRFQPADITVQPGDTVRWLQTTDIPHNVEFKQVPEATNLGSQRVGPYLVSPGQTYEIVVDGRFACGACTTTCVRRMRHWGWSG
ncbi:MAG: hypothetical protein HY700_06855 [Gemmatimonadetes bacterium]|nr:hypothetical protein [Gemmatimonadota bacterium]